VSNAVLERIRAGATVVDVRSPEEAVDDSYPGALNIPVRELVHRAGEIPGDRPVVLFCKTGARSAMGVRLLRASGFSDVVNGGGLSDMPR
jgi:rhodanese-related sulfurtransferase